MNCWVKRLAELTPAELLNIMAARIAVFVVEQHCPYQEIDGLDKTARHIWLEENNEVVGYARIFDEGAGLRIGRVLTVEAYRGKGWGEYLMNEVLRVITATDFEGAITLGAQEYAIEFYRKFGFDVTSAVYLEDGIPHVEMKKEVTKAFSKE